MHYIYGLYKKNIKYNSNKIDEHLFYVGISSSDKNLYFREKNHRKEESNPYKLNIIAKYDFVLKILWQTETKKEAEQREQFLIEWFGRKINNSGILTNILNDSQDYSKIHKKRTNSTKKKISKALKKINQDTNKTKENRDRNLTIPYDQLLSLIEEWAKNPLETQQSFATRNNINRSKFKDWLRLYKPEYIGLTKRKQLELFEKIYTKNKSVKEIIQLFMNETGYTYSKAKGVYYRITKNKLRRKDNVKN